MTSDRELRITVDDEGSEWVLIVSLDSGRCRLMQDERVIWVHTIMPPVLEGEARKWAGDKLRALAESFSPRK